MSTDGKNYQELDDEARTTALKSFIGFYIRQYKRESLEILSSKVSNQILSSINETLDQNRFLGHKELVAVSYRLSKPYYEQILTKLDDAKFTEDGEPVQDWEQIWADQEEELPTED